MIAPHAPMQENLPRNRAQLSGVLQEPRWRYEEAIVNKEKKLLSEMLLEDRKFLQREFNVARPAKISVLTRAR